MAVSDADCGDRSAGQYQTVRTSSGSCRGSTGCCSCTARFSQREDEPSVAFAADDSGDGTGTQEGISKADFSDKWEKFPAFEAYYRKYVMGKFKDGEFLGDLGTLTQSILEDNERAARVNAPAAPFINRYILEIAGGISMKTITRRLGSTQRCYWHY